MSPRARLVAALMPVLALCACKSQQSVNAGFIVEVTSDLVTPKEMNKVVVTAKDPEGNNLYERTFDLGSGGDRVLLPFRVELRAHRETSRPLHILAEGKLDNDVVVSRSATLSFVSDKVKRLDLPLLAVCKSVKCTAAFATCKASGKCEPDSVKSEELPTYVPDQPAAGEDAAVRPADISPDAASTGGTGPGTDSSRAGAGASGTGGTESTGGVGGGTSDDAAVGGNTSSSSTGDTGGVGGNSGIDALADIDSPQGTGGSVSDAGGSGGSDARTGGSSTKVDGGTGGTGGGAGRSGDAGGGGAGPDAGPDGAGGAGGVGGTTAKDGSAGQDSNLPDASVVVPDAPLDTALPDAPCALCAIGANLVHRYTFTGTGSTVTDSVGTAHGTARVATLSGSGTLVLSGGTDQYVDLPDGILSKLTSATLEVWVTWNGGNNNQRILDFGNNEQVSGKYRAVTTVSISPNSYIDNPARLRASYSYQPATSSTFVDATGPLSQGSRHQIVAVFDGPGQTLSMYLNGALVGETTGLGALSQITDTNNMLGRSQYSDAPGFNGTYHEFRIYDAALTAAQVQSVLTAGPDANFSQ